MARPIRPSRPTRTCAALAMIALLWPLVGCRADPDPGHDDRIGRIGGITTIPTTDGSPRHTPAVRPRRH